MMCDILSHMVKNKNKSLRHYLDKKLLLRLRIFIAIGVAMVGIVVYETWVNLVNPGFAFGGLVLGLGIGAFMGKMYKLSWKKEEEKIISQMDRSGFIILALYVIFAILRRALFGEIIHGEALTVA